MLYNETLFLEYFRSIALRSFTKLETFLNSKSKNFQISCNTQFQLKKSDLDN
jgi:hypothetical protein